jgi:ribosome-associated protein
VSEEEPLSKSQRKRDMHDLQELGLALSELPNERIRALNLPETLERALLEVKTFKAHGAVRRQMQFIGRLMRTVDAEPLRAYLDRLAGVSREAVAHHHLCEEWRDRMVADIAAVDLFAAQHAAADRQQLRQLVLGTQREKLAENPPRQFRELFRTITRVLDDEHLNAGGEPDNNEDLP